MPNQCRANDESGLSNRRAIISDIKLHTDPNVDVVLLILNTPSIKA